MQFGSLSALSTIVPSSPVVRACLETQAALLQSESSSAAHVARNTRTGLAVNGKGAIGHSPPSSPSFAVLSFLSYPRSLDFVACKQVQKFWDILLPRDLSRNSNRGRAIATHLSLTGPLGPI